jgi:MFS family permease
VRHQSGATANWTGLKALGYRNFRHFFFGQTISLVGTWMQQTAMIWLVYRLSKPSDQAFLLGLVGFCSLAPVLLFSSVAGVFSDRWNRRRTILVTQSLAMLQAAVLVVLTLSGAVHTVQLAGAFCLVGSLLYTRHLPTLRKVIRPIYRQLEILPEDAFAVPSAAGALCAARLIDDQESLREETAEYPKPDAPARDQHPLDQGRD